MGLLPAALLALVGASFWNHHPPDPRSSMEEAPRHPSSSVAPLPSFGLAAPAPAAGPAPPLFGSVHGETGDPIAQARVCVTCAYPECGRMGPPKTDCVSSDARGEYAWRRLAPGSYRVAATAVGFEPGLAREEGGTRTVVGAGTSLRRDLLLRRGGALLAGSVVDATGGPIPFARVLATQNDEGQFGVAVLSDEDGRFSVSLGAGDVTVRAEADGYASAARRTSVPDTQVELQLTPEASLSGVVVRALDGRPLPGMEVIAFKHTPLMLVDGDGRAVSSEDGSFSIHGLSSGTYHVRARSAQWAGAAAQTVSVAVGEPGGPVRVEARPAVTVAGRVRIAGSNLPCPAGTVFIGSDRVQEKEPFVASSALPDDGAFRIVGVPAGTYTVRVECREAQPRSYPLRVAEEDVKALDLEVESGGTLTGRVVDGAGRGLADRTITVEPEDPAQADAPAQARSARARSDAEGRFRVGGLGPGVYRVSAGEEQGPSRLVQLTTERASTDVTLVVAAGGALRIFIEGPDEPARASLAVFVSSQFGEQPAPRVGDGTYLLRGLQAGPYTVIVSDGRGPSISRKAQLADAQELQMRLVLPEHRDVLSGQVVDGAGNPVRDAWVVAMRSGASSLYEGAPGAPVLTDADGNFELTQLARGEAYDIEAYVTQEEKAIARGTRPGQRITLRLDPSGEL